MTLPKFDFSDRQTRDALRLALQSAIAAAAMFSIMKALGMPERFVGVLSAVMVVQPTAGAAMGEAKDRFLATIIGAIIGLICLALLPSGYGTAAALALSMLVMNLIAGFREEWRYGAVAAVALALGSETDIWQTAVDRSLAIGLGVLVGAVVALIVWRESSEKRTSRFLCSAMASLADYLDTAIGRISGKGDDGASVRKRYHNDMAGARNAVENIRMNDAEPYRDRIENVEKIWSAARYLERIGEEESTVEGDKLNRQIESIRERGHKVLRQLSEGQEPDGKLLDELDDAVAEARQSAQYHDSENDFQHAAKGAVIFTLGELAEALRAQAQAT